MQKESQKNPDSYDYLGASCSSTDCTGLIPRGIIDEEELEAYEALYPYRPPHLTCGVKKDSSTT